MKYRNSKTGAVITTSSAIGGGDWVLVQPGGVAKKPELVKSAPKVAEAAKAAKRQETEKPAGDGVGSVTVKQIKQELDAMGIAYSATAKKQELYDLMIRK
ncbi:hypothetical protein [Lacticaseibacillus absianus]|uniref:hypothetical protein n=1 Tax=Lacticaseibacillus absianus TaxID=2729623 RepID=UPI0015C6DFC4|nr:hypothetical protein [Lacticaseibacillus absianus]